MSSTYHIVFPRGDQTRISIVEICVGMEYELDEYAVASRHSFDDPISAHSHAKTLSMLHGVKYKPEASIVGKESLYLD